MSEPDGPYFEDLSLGATFAAPGLTLTEGRAAVHQSVVGDRLALSLDDALAQRVTGGTVASPALVWDVAIGQSTVATRAVRANLFYRGLAFLRAPALGDTLTTSTEVVGLRENTRRSGRPPTGLAALRMRTRDQHDRPVLDFTRCAMLPLRAGAAPTGHADDLSALGSPPQAHALAAAVASWDLPELAAATTGVRARGAAIREGTTLAVSGGDVVSSAPELARLTLNVAAVHHDARAQGSRLVYGGHTIGLALAQVCRALPAVVTVLAWHGCDHLAPVHEGDTLRSTVTVERVEPLQGRPEGVLAHLRSQVTAEDAAGAPRDVLDWRFVALAVR